MLGCPAGHRFDVARQGHVVLVPGGSRLRADTADMVAARLRVHASGAFDGVRDALVLAAGPGAGEPDGGPVDGLVADLGAGPGTWAAALLDAFPDRHGVALELSVPALRAAARAHDRLAAVGADLTRPAAAGGRLRLCRPGRVRAAARGRGAAPGRRAGARLVVVTPTTEHLAVLRDRLGLLDVPAGKPDRLDGRLAPGWEPVGRTTSVRTVALGRDLVGDVVGMGPNAWHTDARLRAALAALPDEVEDTVAVTVSSYRRRGVPA